MIVDKIYRNYQTGQERIVQVEKPDDIFLRGCATVQTFDAAGHGDLVEECISPNIVTNYVKDQLGRFIFNGLMFSTLNSQQKTITMTSSAQGGIATFAAVPGEANAVLNRASNSTQNNGTAQYMYNPFSVMFLSSYSTPEDATEIWVPNTVVPIAGSTRTCFYDNTNTGTVAASPTVAECSISADGNTSTFVWDYAVADFNGTFQSIHFAYAATANSAQFARTLLASPVTKSNTQTLKITYTFTFTP